MSQAEALLNTLTPDEIVNYAETSEAEPHIVIGSNRIITVPEALKRIAVQYDHNVETVTFDCPRYWDGHDMSRMIVYINYILPNKEPGSYVADNVRVSNDDSRVMNFTWTISRNITLIPGHITFLVCIKKVDENGNESIHWNSELNTDMYVSKGLECAEVPPAEYPDLVTQLLTKISTADKKIENVLSPSSTQLIRLTDIDTTINGLHITIKNNHVTVKGTATSAIHDRIYTDAGLSQFEAGVGYTLSIQNLVYKRNDPNKADYIGMFCCGVPVVIAEWDSHKKVELTEMTALALNWNIQAGTYDKEFDFQIELGTEVTPFEPFYVAKNVANKSITKEKLSDDLQDELEGLNEASDKLQSGLDSTNEKLLDKAEQTSLLNRPSYYAFEHIIPTDDIKVETGYYYGIHTHNTVENFECSATPIPCKEGDIFRVTSATCNMDGHQGVIKCYDASLTLVSSHFESPTVGGIKTFTDKIFIVPSGVTYIAFNCWKHNNNLYSLTVEKAIPYTDEYGLLANTLVPSLPSVELFNKILKVEGDSILQGTGTGNRSCMRLLADKYHMNLTSTAVGGTTLAVHSDNGANKSIYERIVENITSDTECDYFIFNGVTNDITKNIPLGIITDGVDEAFDTSTILGALEATCKHLNTTLLTAKKLFVFVTNRVEKLKVTKEIFAEMKKVLNKWGIPFIDLSNINSLGHWNSSVAKDYYATITNTNGEEIPDPLHPNLEGHRVFYLPYIEKALLYGGYINV